MTDAIAAGRGVRRIAITGASGFVGTYLTAALARRGKSRHPADTLVIPITDDLRDPGAIDAAITLARPDGVVHLAAQASVARTLEGADETFAVNLGGSLNLALAIARRAPAATVLFASSSEVYGESFVDGPVDEATPPKPLNAYARSKRLAEEMFDAVLPATARLIVARPFNHTGPGQSDDFVLPAFAGQIAAIEAARQAPRLMVGNIDVCRDFLDVRDVIAAYLALLDAAPRLPPRLVCNIASGTAVPLRRHVEMLRTLSRANFEIVVDAARVRAVDVPVAVGDAGLIGRLTGWAPRHAMRDTLRDLLAAARASRDDAQLRLPA